MPSRLKLAVRTMRREELDLAMEWAAREGWNPGVADADCFYAADPDGFLIAYLDQEPVACISVVRYDSGFGFLGFYIVKSDMRGRGYGFQVWQAGMERLAGCTVGLDGVVAQQENYSRSGFVLAHRNIRFGGVPQCAEPSDARLKPIRAEMVEAIVAYDRSSFPASRDRFLQCWLRPEHREGLALVDNGAVRGYGVIRTCRTGVKIGPLLDETERIADLLLRSLALKAPGHPLFLDCPEPNQAAIDLATRNGLSPVFQTARMYRGAAPDLSLSRTFGITTLELG
jgi:hypothetical protein